MPNSLLPRGQAKGMAANSQGTNPGVKTYNGNPGNVAFNNSNIMPNSISYGQIQEASAHTLLGNPTGSTADIEEITLGNQLAFSGTALNISGLSVTITTAALTTLGAQGNMVFVNGILTSQTPAT